MISVLVRHKYCLDIHHQISAIKKQNKLIFQLERLVHYFFRVFFKLKTKDCNYFKHIMMVWLVYGVKCHFQQYFSYIASQFYWWRKLNRYHFHWLRMKFCPIICPRRQVRETTALLKIIYSFTLGSVLVMIANVVSSNSAQVRCTCKKLVFWELVSFGVNLTLFISENHKGLVKYVFFLKLLKLWTTDSLLQVFCWNANG
jgi:hypothetical protein